jgi:hypothetical protein
VRLKLFDTIRLPPQNLTPSLWHADAPRLDFGGSGDVSAVIDLGDGVIVVERTRCKSCHYDVVLVKTTTAVKDTTLHPATKSEQTPSGSSGQRTNPKPPGGKNENTLFARPCGVCNRLSGADLRPTERHGRSTNSPANSCAIKHDDTMNKPALYTQDAVRASDFGTMRIEIEM